MTPTLAAVLVWLLLQFGISVWVSRRIGTEADYLVAGRRLGLTLATFSIFATWFGAETLIGSAGITAREGVSLASAEPFGYGLAVLLMGLVFAVPLWRRQMTTFADLYRHRYGVSVERLAALLMIPTSVLWAAAQVRAFGSVLGTAAPALDLTAAIGIGTAFVVAYSAFGGLLADAVTDVIQGALLVIGLVILGVGVLHAIGGVEGIGAALEAGRAARAAAGTATEAPPLSAVLESWAIPALGSVVAPELIGRVIAARSPEVARRSALGAGLLYITVGLIPVGIGLVAAPLVPTLADTEQLLPTLARDLLPTLGFAIFAGGLISAILSTVDSTLLVSSGLLSHNLLVPMLGVADERAKVRLARGGVLGFGLVAFVLALRADGVFALVEEASAFGSAGILVTVCFGLFTSWGGARTAAMTLLAGLLSYIVATVAELATPFLLSVAVALGTYLLGALVDRARPTPAPVPAPAPTG
jgi:Na+/proline symporter